MPIFSPLSLLQIAGGLLICVQQLSSRRFDVAVRRYSSFCRSAQNLHPTCDIETSVAESADA
jgi:hypothetical protein